MNTPLPDDPVTYAEVWENALRVLEAMTPHEREKHFDMGDWGRETECGTVACLAGHCSLDPWFKQRGFIGEFKKSIRYHQDGTSSLMPLLRFNTSTESYFGSKGHEEIFMNTDGTYEQIVAQVKAHIEYLKAGGDPDRGEEDYEDEY